MAKVKKRYDNIIKSCEDKREYRGLELINGMKIVAVSDPTTEKSAAAMCVNVGFLSDPESLPGLAHFCEHMLFLGTKKYPQENEYTKFLSEHGGFSNAFTMAEHTSYYFDVSSEHFLKALDRFAQFFIEPLFNEDVTDREVNAVDSEHDKNRQSDEWRFDQLEKSLSQPGHPYRKFGTGNKETLDILPKQKGINVRNELLDFHRKWYSSNIMTLAVIGKESLDQLEELVAEVFSQVENKQVSPLSIADHPYSKDEVMLKDSVVPIKDIRQLAVSFPIPDYRDYYKAAPIQYLAHLIGHEGDGSLLSALRAKGWCNNLFGWSRGEVKGFDMFCVWVDLTEEGIEHTDDIIHLIFQYIKMLKTEGPKKWVFDEQAELLNMHFRFKDKQSSTALVKSISFKLDKFPIEEVLVGRYRLTEWRSDLIEELLTYLSCNNVRVSVAGKKYQQIANLKEEWYGTEYALEKLSESVIKRWENCELNPDLHMPCKNEFIATDFDLTPRDENQSPHPSIIHETEYCRVWYKQDNEFLLPKANIRFEFVSPFAYLDPMSCNMTYMFVTLFEDALLEYSYAAQLAGLKWELNNTKYGMVLGVGGYNHKQKVLLNKIMDKMTSFKIDPKRFTILKETYIRSLKNFNAEQPYQHANYYLAVILSEQSWTKNDLLEAADKLTIPALEVFIQQLLSKVHVESFVHGNTCKATAMDMVSTVMDRLSGSIGLPLLPCQLLRNREIQLADGANYVYEVENEIHKNSCTEAYYQCSLQSTETNMLLELFVQIISEPCYSLLRTKEQLGYNVFSGIRRSNGTQGLRLYVQSDKHPSYIDSRVEAFLSEMGTYLKDLTDDEFNNHKEALASQRLEKPKQMSAQSARYWVEITSQQYNFDRANIEVAYMRTLTKQDVLKFYNDMIKEGAPHRHKLAVYIISKAEGGAGVNGHQNSLDATIDERAIAEVKRIENITSFKSMQSLYPLVQPFISLQSFTTKAKL